MQLPLSAFLITMSLLFFKSSRMRNSFLERLGFSVFLQVVVASLYSSNFRLLALGGAHCDLGLNECFLPCRVLFRK